MQLVGAISLACHVFRNESHLAMKARGPEVRNTFVAINACGRGVGPPCAILVHRYVRASCSVISHSVLFLSEHLRGAGPCSSSWTRALRLCWRNEMFRKGRGLGFCYTVWNWSIEPVLLMVIVFLSSMMLRCSLVHLRPRRCMRCVKRYQVCMRRWVRDQVRHELQDF